MSITDIKQHASEWLAKIQVSADHEWHRAVSAFVEWADQNQQEKDAVALLTAKGYTVTPPPTAQ